jgi:hypothetical protein
MLFRNQGLSSFNGSRSESVAEAPAAAGSAEDAGGVLATARAARDEGRDLLDRAAPRFSQYARCQLSQRCTTQLNQANLIGSSEKTNMMRTTTKKTTSQIMPVREKVMGRVFATIISFIEHVSISPSKSRA